VKKIKKRQASDSECRKLTMSRRDYLPLAIPKTFYGLALSQLFSLSCGTVNTLWSFYRAYVEEGGRDCLQARQCGTVAENKAKWIMVVADGCFCSPDWFIFLVYFSRYSKPEFAKLFLPCRIETKSKFQVLRQENANESGRNS
jgi:hypothetical protein